MVARVTHAHVKPEDIGEAVSVFDESVIPASSEQEGFVGALLLAGSDGEVFSIVLGDTLADLKATEQSGFYLEQAARFAAYLVDQPRRAYFEVKLAKGAAGGLEANV